MRKNLWLDYELINVKGVPIPEIKPIYQSLLNENERIKYRQSLFQEKSVQN